MFILWFVYRAIEFLAIVGVTYFTTVSFETVGLNYDSALFLAPLHVLVLVMIRKQVFSCIKAEQVVLSQKDIDAGLNVVVKMGVVVNIFFLVLMYNVRKIYDLVVWPSVEEFYRLNQTIDFDLLLWRLPAGLVIVFAPLYIALKNFVDFFSKDALIKGFEKDLKLRILREP